MHQCMRGDLPSSRLPKARERDKVSSKIALEIIHRVAAERKVAVDLMLHKSRCKRPVAEARQQAMYLAHVAAGMTMSSVGEIFGRDRTTIRHACARIEDLRDDMTFDTYLSGLEDEIARLMEQSH